MLFLYILSYSLIAIALISLSLGIYNVYEVHSSGWSDWPIVRQERILNVIRWFMTLWCLVSGLLLLLHISWSLIAIKLYSIYVFTMSLFTLILRFMALRYLAKVENESLLINWRTAISGNVLGFIIMATVSVVLFWAAHSDTIKVILLK